MFIYCFFTIYYCNSTVHTLKNIKNRFHDTICPFKNYFATVFSVFNFQFSISTTINSVQMDRNFSLLLKLKGIDKGTLINLLTLICFLLIKQHRCPTKVRRITKPYRFFIRLLARKQRAGFTLWTFTALLLIHSTIGGSHGVTNILV